MDSLRYFVTEATRRRFRFDTRSALAREFYEGRPGIEALFDTDSSGFRVASR